MEVCKVHTYVCTIHTYIPTSLAHIIHTYHLFIDYSQPSFAVPIYSPASFKWVSYYHNISVSTNFSTITFHWHTRQEPNFVALIHLYLYVVALSSVSDSCFWKDARLGLIYVHIKVVFGPIQWLFLMCFRRRCLALRSARLDCLPHLQDPYIPLHYIRT